MGGVTSGYWATGSVGMLMAPMRMISREQTDAKTGRESVIYEITAAAYRRRPAPAR